MNIELTPVNIKRTIDGFVKELDASDQSGYTLNKETELVRVWSRSRGVDEWPDQPISRAHHFFPNVDDPRIIMAALN